MDSPARKISLHRQPRRYARLYVPCRQPEFIIAIRDGLGAAFWELRRVQPQLFADAANQIRIEAILRSGQRQLRDTALAMDRQMSVANLQFRSQRLWPRPSRVHAI